MITVPGGGVLEIADLDEATERARVAENGGRGLLAPYLHYDPAAPPLVLVHGIQCSPETLRPLADRLAARCARQLYFFLYDDVNRYLDRSGDDLARALVDLGRRCREAGAPPSLWVVAHSMGGIVARCAMNSLVDPRWFPEHFTLPSAPPDTPPERVRGTEPEAVAEIRLPRPAAADFARVDLVTIDTPWSGFIEPPIDVRNRVERESTFVDLVSNSALMAALHEVPFPPHFTVNHLEADNAAAGVAEDRVVALCELDDAAIEASARHFAGDEGALKRHPRLRNQLRALAADEDYPAMAGALIREAEAGTLTRDRFIAIVGRGVPAFAGTHVSVLEDPELAAEVLRTLGRHDG